MLSQGHDTDKNRRSKHHTTPMMLNRGFTLPEMMAVVAILGILCALAIPSFSEALDHRQLRGASEQFAAQLKRAHTEAIKRSTDVHVSVTSGNNWCYGVSDALSCDCSNQCLFNGVNTTFDNSNYDRINLTLDGYTTDAGTSYLQFNSTRGTSNHTGTAHFSVNNKTVSVSANQLGLTQICSDQLSEYPTC